MADTQYPDNISILDLENTLKCPVCFELRDGYIFVCQRGHHLCSVCSRSLVSCPTCQCAITGCRNFVVETLISKYGFLKLETEHHSNQTIQPSNSTENSAAGANTYETEDSDTSSMPDTQKTLIANETRLKPLSMPSGTYPCDLVNCKPNKINLGVGAMIPHLRNMHGNIMHYVYNTSATVEFRSPQFFYRHKRRYHQAYHISNMGVFFFYIVVLNDGHINMWVTSAAPSSVTLRFRYEIYLYVTTANYYCTSFVGQVCTIMPVAQVHTGRTWELKVHPCGTEKTWLLERKEVMVVPPSQHQLIQKSPFEMEVMIVYD